MEYGSVWVALAIVWGADAPPMPTYFMRPGAHAVFAERQACLEEVERWKKETPGIFTAPNPSHLNMTVDGHCYQYRVAPPVVRVR